ncbi:InlB B-repeat-containing protein [Eubacterium oxidoreducens]|uniref:Listeria/Bacterioides repeat-containing protein n=1 Tax=Eubacterium oxidoreducens TaxID=1732 RepID=A0A1G6CGT3_EUBOX|nr:InlB B-repeat-containing protein [Eubacterium oxidoreducens]SDB32045.1 Listeria/Bacterioides repeat-containing protein [Eubacterium oxidoreducens]
MKKKIITMITSMAIAVTAIVGGAMPAGAAQLQTAQQSEVSVTAPVSSAQKLDIDLSEAVEGNVNISSASKGSTVYHTQWDKYSNNYAYNKLSKAKKAVWDQMDAACRNLLTTTNDAQNYSGTYGTTVIYGEGLSETDMYQLFVLFKYSNPQYYFVGSQYAVDYYGSYCILMMAVYSDFADGSDRKSATSKFKSKIDTAVNTAKSKYSSDAARVQYFHDYICKQVSYYDGEESSYGDETYFTQSAYSVLGDAGAQSVCAGYSLSMELLCNALGIDCMAVTSEAHAWNKVRLNDSWYNIDVTWDDDGAGYWYYLRSNAKMKEVDAGYYAYHTAEAAWSGKVPACTLDSGSTVSTAKGPKAISKKVATPKIKVKLSGKKYKVTLSCATSGATIYYTTNGKTPDCSATISNIYKKSFKLTKAKLKKLKVIAVKDQYKDSSVKKFKKTMLPIKVTYKVNGGKLSGKKYFTAYAYKKVGKLKKPTKAGYVFKGWYTKKSGGKKVTKNTKLKKNTTIYARWSKK